MEKTRYVYKSLLKLALNRRHVTSLCLLGCTVVMACIFIFFSVQRRIIVNDLYSWSSGRGAAVYFKDSMSAKELYECLEKQPGLNGYIFYMHVADEEETGKQPMLHGVRGAISERLTPETAMAGHLEGCSEDIFILRHANFVPEEFFCRADEMVIEIDGVPFSCGGVQNNTWDLSYGAFPATARAVTLERPGAETIFEDIHFPGAIIITAACAAKHDYPVAALRVCYTDPDSKPLFLSLLHQFGDGVARYDMPWVESEAAPSLEEVPFGMVTKLLPVLIAMVTMMTLLYFWLGSLRFALRVWQRQGAGRGPCRRGLFLLGMTLLAGAALLGFGIYRLVLLWGGQNGLMLGLPGSMVSLLLVIYVCVCMLCMGLYAAKAARISLEKGGLRE